MNDRHDILCTPQPKRQAATESEWPAYDGEFDIEWRAGWQRQRVDLQAVLELKAARPPKTYSN